MEGCFLAKLRDIGETLSLIPSQGVSQLSINKLVESHNWFRDVM
jgi:hypothetical protein